MDGLTADLHLLISAGDLRPPTQFKAGTTQPQLSSALMPLSTPTPHTPRDRLCWEADEVVGRGAAKMGMGTTVCLAVLISETQKSIHKLIHIVHSSLQTSIIKKTSVKSPIKRERASTQDLIQVEETGHTWVHWHLHPRTHRPTPGPDTGPFPFRRGLCLVSGCSTHRGQGFLEVLTGVFPSAQSLSTWGDVLNIPRSVNGLGLNWTACSLSNPNQHQTDQRNVKPLTRANN